MPSFFNKEKQKSWWRQLFKSKKKTNSSLLSSNNSSNNTLDWRSLSPNKPPLPFFIQSSSSSSSSIKQQNDTIDSSSPIIIINQESNTNLLTNTTLDIPIDKKKLNSRPNSEPLCPILEESETMITESIVSNNNLSSQSDIIQHSSSSMEITNTQNQSSTSSSSIPSSSNHLNITPNTSNNIAQTNIPLKKSTSSSFIPKDLIGNEELCKKKFIKMVLATYKHQKNNHIKEMQLIFNENDNIDMMKLVKHNDQAEYHKFDGNSQYIPPELSLQPSLYLSELADVWVLGIFLYRMLAGKYPFIASNDKQLFKKMLSSDFSIPNELSADAKDLLRRMLAPDNSRASLDLIIYHPWLLNYRDALYNQIHKMTNTTTPAPVTNVNANNNRIESETSIKANPVKKKKSSNIIKKTIMLVVHGPFPPPKRPYQELSHLGTRDSVFY